ncbi:MAG: hypothetical protein KAS94_10770, partial [Desulfobulbaceae bacterium]|nr:hypothetical protein [Desulfobulbaceae bacterium]
RVMTDRHFDFSIIEMIIPPKGRRIKRIGICCGTWAVGIYQESPPLLTGFAVETAVFVKAQWDRRKATSFQRVYHKKGLIFVTFHPVIETDL